MEKNTDKISTDVQVIIQQYVRGFDMGELQCAKQPISTINNLKKDLNALLKTLDESVRTSHRDGNLFFFYHFQRIATFNTVIL